GEVFVPNIFSPNNDGNNDVFYVRGKCIEKMQWVIYNRWGAKVFESDSPQNGWDGSYKGKNLDAAVFVWHLKYKLSIDTEEKTMKGNITLVK
ncbi:MAG: gliding motility-associated C-terminal domain-containing protein, partial [Bacteroidetes bacterium]|nr:gliding motility-associated C-terminal domain-containing protein [Bacteroidota bacterium]